MAEDQNIMPNDDQITNVDMADVASRSTTSVAVGESVDPLPDPVEENPQTISDTISKLPPRPTPFDSREDFMAAIDEYDSTQGRAGRLVNTANEFQMSPEQFKTYIEQQDKATSLKSGRPVAQEPLSVGEHITDIAMRGPMSGFFGFASSIASAAEPITKPLGNFMENMGIETPFNEAEESETPRAATIAGEMTGALTQFALGFAAAKGLLKGTPLGGNKMLPSMVQGGIADAISFDGHQERLSNLLTQFNSPILNNAVTQYLEAKPGDSQAEGRLKNTIEGLMLGGGAEVVFRGIRLIKRGSAAMLRGGEAAAHEVVVREAAQVEKALQQLASEGVDTRRAVTRGRQIMTLKEMVTEEGKLGVLDLIEKVNRGEMDLADLLNGSHINFDYVDTPDKVKALMAGLSESVSDEAVLRAGMDNTFEGVRQATEDLLLDPRETMARLVEGGEIAPRMAVNINLGRQLFNNVVERISVAADGLRSAGKTDEEIIKALGPMMDFAAAVRLEVHSMSSGIARGLNVHKMITGKDLFALSEEGGLDAFMRAMIMTGGDVHKMGQILKAPMTFTEKAVGVFNHLWINGLLSGPRTQIVNFVTSFTLIPISNAEAAIGYLAAGNAREAAVMGRTYFEMVTQAIDSIKWGVRAAYLNRPLGAPGSFIAEETSSMSSTMLGKGGDPTRVVFKGGSVAGSKTVGAAVDAVGAVTGVPIRMLLGADEVNKQLAARSLVRARLWQEAAEQGMTGRGMAEYITDGMAEAFDPKTGRILDEQALNHALDISFARNLESVDGLLAATGAAAQQIVSAHPGARQITPFVRAPTNLIQHAYQRTPLFQFASQQLRNDLRSADPLIVAKAKGKIATGSTLGIGIAYLTYSGMITGRLSPNPDIARQQKEAGMRPYSFVTTDANGKKTYTSYERMDPIAGAMRTVADMSQVVDEIERQEGKVAADAVAIGIVEAFGRNMVNNHWMRGVTEMIEAGSEGGTAWDKFWRNRAASFVPAIVRDMNQDPTLRRIDSWLDAIYARVPGWSKDLPATYNALGEPMVKPMGVGFDVLNPFYVGHESDDPVDIELATMNQGFSLLSRNVGNIDLTQFTDSATGKDAYEAYNMLVERPRPNMPTLREALRSEIASERYQRYPKLEDSPTTSVRAIAIRKILAGYRSRAFEALLSRNDDLRTAIEADKRATGAEMLGAE